MIFAVGYSAYISLPREEKPEATKPIVNIVTNYYGVSPVEMEMLVTDVIEMGVKDIEGIDEIKSTTSNGNSKVSVLFVKDWDMDIALSEIQSAISSVQLPDEALEPKALTMNSVEAPIMNITVSGEYSLTDLKNYAELLQAEIYGVDGISEIALTGGLDRVINIYMDKQKLDMYDLTSNEISQSIIAANKENPVGSDEIDTMEYSVRIVGNTETVEDIEDIIVAELNGFPIYLKDISTVKNEYQIPEYVSERYDSLLQDEKEMIPAISMSIHRESESDVIGISTQIREIIETQKGILYPEDVNIIISNEDAVNVNNALNDVLSNAISGLLLVIVVLFIFIGFKESIIVAFVIPLSLFISFACMSVFGISLNTMSMVALILALGMLVDNAIVIMENIDRIRDEGSDIISSAKIATNQVAPAVLAATLTTISAFIPIAFAGGTLGELMSCIPLVVIFAIVASFFISIIITPSLCSRLLSKHKAGKKLSNIARISSIVVLCVLSALAFSGSYLAWIAVPLFGTTMIYRLYVAKPKGSIEGEHGRIIDCYGNMLGQIIKKKTYAGVWIVACVAVFVISIYTITSDFLKIELLPKRDSTALNIVSAMPEGYLLEDSLMIGDQMEGVILEYDEVLSVVSNINKSSASFSLEIVPVDEREISSTQLIDYIREDLGKIVCANITVGQTLRGFQGSESPIMIEIIGDDSDSVEKVSNDFIETLKNIEGTTEVTSSMTGGPPELLLSIDKEKAYQYGLNTNDIASKIKESISSTNVTSFILDGEEVDISLMYEGSNIDSVSDYSSITFDVKDGSTVYFDQIVEIEETKGLTNITHQDLKRIETVSSNITDEYTSTEVLDKFSKIIENYDMPKGIVINYAGESQDIKEAFTNLFISMGVGIFLVYTSHPSWRSMSRWPAKCFTASTRYIKI